MSKPTTFNQIENKPDLAKKEYVSPKLELLGSFIDLTQEVMVSEQEAPPPEFP